MRNTVLAIVVTVLLPAHAFAEPDAGWDATYEHWADGGGELCPDSSAAITIAGGKLTIVWNVTSGDKLLPVGRIEGTVHAGGAVDHKVKLNDPLPADVVQMMRDTGDLNQLSSLARDMKLSLHAGENRELQFSSNLCYATWAASAPPSPRKQSRASAIKASAPKPDQPPPQSPSPAPVKPRPHTPSAKSPAPPEPSATPAPVKPQPHTPSPKSPSRPPNPPDSPDTGRSGQTPTPKLGNGIACDLASECASGRCSAHTCVSGDQSSPRLVNGLACDLARECASRHCDFHKCTSGDSSNPALGTGVACDFPRDCASGRCDYHKCR